MTDELLAAYRHDTHKLTGERHDTASPEVRGVEVNRAVPLGADEDAAALSRPRASHSQTVPTHATNRRLSLLTGDIAGEDAEAAQVHESKITDRLAVDDAQAAHERWLTTDVAAAYNESAYDPYTSLKYHTLLVAALLDNYRSGRSFSDLQLVVDHPDEVVAFRTVFTGDQFALRINGSGTGRPSTGGRPSTCRQSTTDRSSRIGETGRSRRQRTVCDASGHTRGVASASSVSSQQRTRTQRQRRTNESIKSNGGHSTDVWTRAQTLFKQ